MYTLSELTSIVIVDVTHDEGKFQSPMWLAIQHVLLPSIDPGKGFSDD